MKLNRWTFVATVCLALPLVATAQNLDEGDDPDHGVARISLLNGDVSVQRGDTGEIVAADLNAPLVALDHVLTGPNSRAEIQFDWADMIRLGPVSEVRIGELRDRDYLIQVAEGTTTFRILRDTNARIEISTPTVSIRPTDKGIYRVTVRPDGATEVVVRSGRADIFTPRGTETLRSGRMLQARGTSANPEFMIVSAYGKDDWDRWNENRDRDLERSRSYDYVSRDIYGADDLDAYGRWVYDSPYGYVWVPNVARSWAPYRIGRWSWVNFYGWTWISGDPWGWAPYHYGRWYSSSYGWAWYPGAVSTRYYWRPALVGFFGWGSRSGVQVGISIGNSWGNIGWVPLAPYEVYNPWYGPRYRNGNNTTYIDNSRNVTVINNTNITNVYRNARQNGGRDGVTSMTADGFGRNRVSNDNFVKVSNSDLTRAGQVRGALPVTVNPDSRRYADRSNAAEIETRAASRRNRQFATGPAVTREIASTPTPAAANPPAGANSERTRRVTDNVVDRNTAVRSREPARAAPATPSNGGWRRVEDSTGAAAGPQTVDRSVGTRRAPETRTPENRSSDVRTADRTTDTRRRTYEAPVQTAPPVQTDRVATDTRRSRVETGPAPVVRERTPEPRSTSDGGGSRRSTPTTSVEPPNDSGGNAGGATPGERRRR
jgi:hypothetical protein